MKVKLPNHQNCTIGLIGLGYVGLPLAINFSKKQICLRTGESLYRKVIAFDINKKRINELKEKIDRTGEVSKSEFDSNKDILFTNDKNYLQKCDVFIITVPTPVDKSNNPDFKALISASSLVGSIIKERLKNRDSDESYTAPIIIYESTVYPGATEDICVKELEQESGMKYNSENIFETFFCGYSPERINPGDKNHTLLNITKVTSGSTDFATAWIDQLYGSIIKAGTHIATSIKVAEAAKVIENTQRDINIALINELAHIFREMNIDTNEVLDAACTKWNFLPFKPGLVGGHCIGVDPYYLTYKAELLGLNPQMLLAGRRINDSMASWVAEQIMIEIIKNKLDIYNFNLLILGFTFKANCPDTRNTKVLDLIKSFKDFGLNVHVYDPVANKEEVFENYNIEIISDAKDLNKYHALICSVGHKEFKKISNLGWINLLEEKGIICDLANIVPKEITTFRL